MISINSSDILYTTENEISISNINGGRNNV